MEVKYDFIVEGICKGCPHGHFDIVNTFGFFIPFNTEPLPAVYNIRCEHEEACKRIVKLMQEVNNEPRSEER